VHARDTYLPQRTKGLRPESESLDFLVTPTFRSWNSVLVLLRDWNALWRSHHLSGTADF